MVFSTTLIITLVVVVLFVAGTAFEPLGRLLSVVFYLVGIPLAKLEDTLVIFKERLISNSNGKHPGLRTMVILMNFVIALAAMIAEVYGGEQAVVAVFPDATLSLPPLPSYLNFFIGGLYICISALFGAAWIESQKAIPEDARIFLEVPPEHQKGFNRLIKWGLVLSLIASTLYYALKVFFLINPDSGMTHLLQLIVLLLMGVLVPMVGILALYILAIGLQSCVSLVFALFWLALTASVDICEYLRNHFEGEKNRELLQKRTIRGVTTGDGVAADTPRALHPSVIQTAPTVAVLPGYTVPPLEEIVLDAIPVSLKTTPFPGRAREHFPIEGSDTFKSLINRIIDELALKTPDYYEQALEYLPKADYDTSIRPAIGRSDGLFTFDENTSYHLARFVFLHEVGHCVYILQHNDVREEMANDYANKATAKIESWVGNDSA